MRKNRGPLTLSGGAGPVQHLRSIIWVNFPSSPQLFRFERVDERLESLPWATRRVLDRLGLRIQTDAYAALPARVRQVLALCGSSEPPDLERARTLLEGVELSISRVEQAFEPPWDQPSDVVAQALTQARPLSAKLWQSLSGLERYVLHRICAQGHQTLLEEAYAEIVGLRRASTHLSPRGGVVMVSVADKTETQRHALAECWLRMNEDAFAQLQADAGPKKDILATARLAGILGTKKTADLIPLCHPLPLLHAEVDFELEETELRVRVTCSVIVVARTGVEMEALCGAQLAALTVYDMLKSVDRAMVIGPCRLLFKSGGQSGNFQAPDGEPSQ